MVASSLLSLTLDVINWGSLLSERRELFIWLSFLFVVVSHLKLRTI